MKAKPKKAVRAPHRSARRTPNQTGRDEGAVTRMLDRHRRFQSRHQRFARCQEQKRYWIAFEAIADLHSSEVATDKRDAARSKEFDELAIALRKGGFDRDGRTMVIVVPPDGEAFRLEKRIEVELRTIDPQGAAKIYEEAYLKFAWVHKQVLKDWYRAYRHRPPSPAWGFNRKASSSLTPKEAAVVKAYWKRFSGGVPIGMKNLARDALINEEFRSDGVGQASTSTIKRALKKARL